MGSIATTGIAKCSAERDRLFDVRLRWWPRPDAVDSGYESPSPGTANPFAANLEDHLLAARRHLASYERRPPGWRAWPARTSHWIRLHRWDIALLVIPTIAFVSGGVGLLVTFPWSTGGDDFAAVTLGAATIVGLGTVLMSSATLALARMLELGPGNIRALLNQPTVWVLSIGLVPLEALLFYLSTVAPDRATAISSGLIASGVFGLFITISRELFRSADGERLVLRLADELVREQKSTMRVSERIIRSSLRSSPHRAELVEAELRTAREMVVNRTLLRLAAAIRASVAAGRTHEATLLWLRLVKVFSAFGDESGGRVGGISGPLMTVLEVGEPLVGQVRLTGDDHSATLITQSLAALAAIAWPTNDGQLLRGAARSSLERVAIEAWNADSSRVPASAVDGIGRSIRQVAALREGGEALVTFEILVRIAQLADATGKAHIGVTATEQLAEAPLMFLPSSVDEFRVLVDYWGSKLDHIAPLLARADLGLDPPRDRLFPGRSIRPGATLQMTMSSLDESIDHARVLGLEILDVLGRNMHTVAANADGNQHLDPIAARALALELCVLLAIEHASPDHTDQSVAHAGLKLLRRIVDWTPPNDRPQVLLLDDVAELAWSVLITCGALGATKTAVASEARHIRDLVGPLESLDVHFTSISASYLVGLAIVSGETDEQLAITQNAIDAVHVSYFQGYRFGGLGLAPSINRNQTVHFSISVERVESWAREQFQALGADEEADAE